MPNKVGILAMEVYFPSTFVSQNDLEVANCVSKGKYTVGLGQDAMAFTGDLEDVNSISLTVVQSLLEKYKIDKTKIGRLEVGTESLVDKSKSTKTILMSLFPESSCADIEGATVINACYGGTAALLNALSWVDSASWDGRYAIVVAADIAVYADGPARPTGGCGSVAMLIGRDAPLRIDLRTRASFASHVWDFFKPNMDSEYPEVNGMLSQKCYLQALEYCYNSYLQKSTKLYGDKFQWDSIDHFLFHSPYNKLVQKGFARVIFQDMLHGRINNLPISKWLNKSIDETYEDKELESLLKNLSASQYDLKVAPYCELSKQIGNTYTAAVYMNLANLIATKGNSLEGQKIALFSYGSGAIATMLEISIPKESYHGDSNPFFSLEFIQSALDLPNRLSSREKMTPQDLTEALLTREQSHGFVPYVPVYNVEKIFPGTFYLQEITTSFERKYSRKPVDSFHSKESSMKIIKNSDHNALLSTQDVEESPLYLEGSDTTSESNTPIDEFRTSTSTWNGKITSQGQGSRARFTDSTVSPVLSLGIRRSGTVVFASGRYSVKVVISGVAAALPGSAPSVECIQRLINGENMITPLSPSLHADMLSKNVVTLVKDAVDGSQKKVPVLTIEDNIKLAAAISSPDLSKYGISESIASTMDRAVQVSVAAGLEALKDAGIISGEGPDGWILPASMQDTTGVVYATSFPALDAAIAEVTKYFTSQSIDNQNISKIISILRNRMESVSNEPLSTECETALNELLKSCENMKDSTSTSKPYEFDRKFLFRVLVLGNAQLAQIIKARGPNMQTNAACAGSTQAVALAYDMIQLGRAERMVVIAGDNASSDALMPWLGNGFRALGAATTCGDIKLAAVPFDHRRSGMILGAGGIGMVLESEDGARRRHVTALQMNPSRANPRPFKCRLLASLYTNSAYHGAAMDRKHIAAEMERFIAAVEAEQGISRKEIAMHGVYFSHETSTHASASASCASNEIHGLRTVFGDDLQHLMILNTKGFTGHPMGVSFEDVVAAEVLRTQFIPPVANNPTADIALGPGLKLSQGGHYPCKYALRFAAGFGSQIALALYGSEAIDHA